MVEKQETTGDRVVRHYDAVAETYHLQYEADTLHDIGREYPANYFRLELLVNSFVKKGIKRVIEVGVGEGTPLATLARAGIETWGFDVSEPMVRKSRDRMRALGLPGERICRGDIQDPSTYARLIEEGPFDGLIALGVMPHVAHDGAVLDNMAALLKPGGSVFVEFRNKLFSLFTFNRHTHDFILNDLLPDVDEQLKRDLSKALQNRVRMDVPPSRTTVGVSDAPGYDAILAKFHNPFEVTDLFRQHGFVDPEFLWYHYHPTLPWLEKNDPERFRKAAIALEHESSGWRGLFLCSAFIVEAVKGGS